MSDDAKPPLPPIPPPPDAETDASRESPPPLPPPADAPPPPIPPPAPPATPKKSRSGAFRHLQKASRADQLQDFARTGFAGYRRVVVVEKRRGPGLAWILLSVLVLVAAAAGIYQWLRAPTIEETLPESLAGTNVEQAPSPTTVDAETWRSDIESLEGFLFAPPSEIGPLRNFGSRFEEEAGAFADRLRVEGGEKEGNLADELDELVKRTLRSDFNVRRLKEVREAWLGIRAIHLDDAEWMIDGADADEAADLEVYRQAAEQIRDLISNTLATAEDLTGAGMGAEQRRDEWRRTLFYYRDDLKVIRAGLPRRPGAGAPTEELEAIHRIDSVFIEAESLASSHQNLSTLDRVAFERAIENADEAAAFFDRRLES